MKPYTMIYVLSCVVVAWFTMALLFFAQWQDDDCKQRGGTQVRTSNGYVCAVLKEIP